MKKEGLDGALVSKRSRTKVRMARARMETVVGIHKGGIAPTAAPYGGLPREAAQLLGRHVETARRGLAMN